MTFKEIITDDYWLIENIEFWGETKEYHFTATHDDGRIVNLSEKQEIVDNILKELQDE